MAAPTYVAAGAATAGTTTTSVTVNKPTGTAEFDTMWAVVVNGGANAAPSTVPSGWALLDSANQGTGWAGVYWKAAGNSEPSSYTWSGFTDSCTGCMVSVNHNDNTTPVDVRRTQPNTNANGLCNSITTTAGERLILALIGVADNTSMSTWAATDPASLTERIEQLSSGGNDTGSGIATAAQGAAGATGNLTITLAGSRDNTVFLIALKAPPSTTPVSSDLDLRWQVKTQITSDLDARWAVRSTITSDLDARWLVKNLPTAAYSFNESSGDAIDASGNGHDFTPTGGDASRSVSGHTSGGLDFAGAGPAGPTVESPAFGQTTDRTVMAWLKLDASPGTRWVAIWEVVSIGSGAWGILLLSGNIHIQARNSSTFVRASTTAPTDTAWHHVAGTYVESTGVVTLYVDGTSVGTNTITGPLRTDADNLILGSADGEPFVLDDFRVYASALDASEITTAMNTPVTATSPVSSDLDLRWQVKTQIDSDLDARWAVKTVVDSDLDARWAVRSTITSDLDARWAIRSTITSDLDARWAIRSLTDSDLDARWAVRSTITSDLDLRWPVRNVLDSDLDARWAIRSMITSDLDARWAIRASLDSDLDLRWAIEGAGPVSSDLDARWAIRAAVSADADLRWAIRASLDSDLDARWQVLTQISSDLDARWPVRTLVLSAVDLRWAVEGAGGRNVTVEAFLAVQTTGSVLDSQGRIVAVLADQET